MAALARVTASLSRLSDHLLPPRVSARSPSSIRSSCCDTFNFRVGSTQSNAPLPSRSDYELAAIRSSFEAHQNVPQTSAKPTRCLSSESGKVAKLACRSSASPCDTRVTSVEESISYRSDTFYNAAELAVPLCERPGSCIVSLIDVYTWRNVARELATSVGSEFLDADGGPGVSDLLRELEWLLDDVVAACASSSQTLDVHSSLWKPCTWRDVKDLRNSITDRSRVTGDAEEDVTDFAGDVSAIYGAFGALCKERHTDPVNEFAADCGCSCDGIRESMAEMASNVEISPESEARISSNATLMSRLDNIKYDGHDSTIPSLLRTTRLRLLLRMSIDELDKAWRERIERRRPFQYVVAAAHWRDLVLGVVEGVLIPRPETEQIVDLVEAAISEDKSLGQGLWADLGTGSGAIAIGLARLLEPSGSVVAIDASSVALAVAERNVRRHSLQDKINLMQGFWFSPLEDKQGELAGVVSNPPYIPSDNLAGLQAEVGEHEPKIALDGGPDGMRDLRQICSGSAVSLRSGGFLALETNGGEQAESLCDVLSTMRVFQSSGIPVPCFRDVKQVKDFASITRFVTAKRC